MNGRTRVALHGGVATFAAATALSSVFTNWGWLFPVTGAIIVVVLVSELVRWSPIPSGLSPLLAAAAVSCYLTATETSSRAYGGVFPTESSLRQLGAIARSGFHDVSALSTPVPTHRGLVLLATVGLAGVALVVDLFAATMRRAALAGLPLLAVFALSTAVAKHGVGWLPFVVATAGYLWLLLADSRDRLSRWGRPVGFDRDNRPRFTWSDQEVAPAPLSVMGRRIGFSAIAVAVVVPLLFPGLRGGVPQHNGNGLGFGGGSGASRVTLNPIVRIQAQLVGSTVRDVMTVTTSDPEPGYLRLTSLDRFDGSTFSPSTLQAPISAQVSRGIKPPAVAGKAVQTQISVSALSTPWLPVPQQVESVHVAGDWRFDPASDTIFSARNETDGLQYAVNSTKPDWTVAQLESAKTIDPQATAMLQLPASVSLQVRNLTTHVLAAAHATTPFDKALAIQQFLTSPRFTYDVNVASSASSDALANFLLHTHRGFCQQYASAMAVMARIARIPSRVAVGFTHGEQQADGTWTVTTRDAHAWPELEFGGIGWVPFEPTPRTDGQTQVPNYAVAQSNSKAGKGGAPDQSQKIAAGKRGGKASAPVQSRAQLLDHNVEKVSTGGRAATSAAEHHGSSARAIAAWSLLVLALLFLVIPGVVRIASRRRRWRHAVTPAQEASAAWAELRASAIDADAGWIDGLSPRATARVLRAESGAFATAEIRALDRIVEAVQRAWYAPDADRARTDTLEQDVADLRIAMMAEATIWQRLARRIWPRSTMQSGRELLGRFGALLDASDMAAARLRARLRPRHAG